ncbi:MAG: hypothetical protein AB1696_12200 [Planctomycetota bacterium]
MSKDSPVLSQGWLTHTRAGAIVFVVGCIAAAWMAMDYARLRVEHIVAKSALADANDIHTHARALSNRRAKTISDLAEEAKIAGRYLSLPEDITTRIAFCVHRAAPEQMRVTSLTVRESPTTDLTYEFQAEACVFASSWREALPILARCKENILRSAGPLDFKSIVYAPAPQIQAKEGEITAIIAGMEQSAARPFTADPSHDPAKAAEEFRKSGNLFQQACCLHMAAEKFLRTKGDVPVTLSQYEKAIELYTRCNANRLAGLALLDLAEVYAQGANDSQRALECLRRARVIAQSEKDPLLDALCLAVMNRMLHARGQSAEAAACLEQAIQILSHPDRTSEEDALLRDLRLLQKDAEKRTVPPPRP